MKNKIIEAVLKINPTAEVSVSGDDINSIVWENGTTPIPLADIQAQIPVVEQEIADEATNKETRKATAKQKLIDLGLTEEEIKALIGV
tara:strand:+ start:561 stop:824 length:264 start_codon:yes stop_codon:yes gene_type:complete